MNFWRQLPKPFFALAPMADVTDAAFRSVIAKHSNHGQAGGGPDVFWTEFVSADGLASDGRESLLIDLKRNDSDTPIVAQIFGSNPENMELAARLVRELGFDGVDINMGCPDRSIEGQGAGAAMIQSHARAREVIDATIRGAEGLPVSVKTRIGYNKNETDTWIPVLLDSNIQALTIHGRTRKEMSKVPADWGVIKEVARMAHEKNVIVIGNGDVKALTEGKVRAQESGVDGVMIGRGVFGNPWLFNEKVEKKNIPVQMILKTVVEHAKLFDGNFRGDKNFAIMRKHFSAYVRGFKGSKDLRMQLMTANSASEVNSIVKKYLLESE